MPDDEALLRSIRAFAARDWSLPERVRLEQAAEEFRVEGPRRALERADGLRVHAWRVLPGSPTADARAADLAHHLRLRELLDRAARGLARR